MKKKTIFTLFIIPLVTVMVIQALISYGTFLFSRTPFVLNDNSVGILEQTVENRKLILENNMVRSWSGLEFMEEQATEGLKQILERERIAAPEFLENEKLKEEYLGEMIEPALEQMRKNSVTGSFLILSDLRDEGDGKECSGIYFRNSGPGTVNKANTDILMERGLARFSHNMNIPLGNLWTTGFHFARKGEEKKDEFFYCPYEAALAHTDAEYDQLGFWSRPFTLNDRDKDSYELITYSVPLIFNKEVYGVLGVEIAVSWLQKNLPARELVDEGESGYMLAELDEKGNLIPLVSTFQGPMTWGEEGIATETTPYDGLFKLAPETETDETLYAEVSRLHLYDTNTPFSDRVWVVAGIQSCNKLFGMGNSIVIQLFVAILIGLAFGVCCIYGIVSHLTKPIRSLAECIDQSTGAHLKDFPGSGIKEIDGLYDVVNNLTLKQQKTENRLLEEKERYRIALQSSTDTLFSFDLERKTADVYHVHAVDGSMDAPELYFTAAQLEKILDEKIHEDDLNMLKELFQNAEEELYAVFEAGSGTQMEDYRWFELSGKVLRDTDGKKSKIIGSVRNIHEQRVKELATLDMVRRDAVMGIYKKSTGESLIISELNAGKTGCLILLDIDKFLELDEKYGMVFGDAVLEQIGAIVRYMVKEINENGRKATAVRMGGDEILLWLEKYGRKEAQEILAKLREQVSQLYDDASFRLQISGGITERENAESYQTLLCQAGKALSCAKLIGNGQDAVYEELTEEQLKCAPEKKEISDIVGSVYDRNIGMVPLVFNFFDRSSDLMGIMPVLLAKLGNRYGLSDILITGAEPEFYTVHVSWQWHRTADGKVSAKPRYCTKEEFEGILERIDDRMILYQEEEASDTDRKIFFLPPKSSGIITPLYDNGRYAGSITYAAGPSGISEADRCELQEISKVMEANINREKYDLASRAKSDFLSRMSHEIRTPMNAIMGMTTIAMSELEETDKVKECLKKIDGSSQYLLRLINDILDMSKIESGKMKLEFSDFSLREVADGIHSLVAPQLEEKRIQYEEDILIQKEWVRGDFLHLKQVLVNLAGNAVKFTPEGGKILLTVRQDTKNNGASVYFSVKDTGIGVSERNRKRIFQSFEQADGDTARVYGGTGLGLAISERLVRMMGGHIRLESEEGKGSDFSFRIQLKPVEMPAEKKKDRTKKRQAAQTAQAAQAAQAVAEESGVETASGKTANDHDKSAAGRRILLVEDNALNMEIAQTILEMHSCLVETAENGREAVEKFAEKKEGYYDLILMDIRMPVMDGLEACRKIRSLSRKDARKIPIVAMSANAFAEDVRKSLESGMNGHLSKPINVEELMETLDRLIE